MQEILKSMDTNDYSRFERRPEQRREPVKKQKSERGVSKFTVCAYLVCFALLLGMIFSYVQLNEISDRPKQLADNLAELKEQNQLLEIQITQKMSGEQIVQRAMEDYGMVTLSRDQVTYVNTHNTDTVEIVSQDQLLRDRSQILAGLAQGVQWLVEYIN